VASSPGIEATEIVVRDSFGSVITFVTLAPSSSSQVTLTGTSVNSFGLASRISVSKNPPVEPSASAYCRSGTMIVSTAMLVAPDASVASTVSAFNPRCRGIFAAVHSVVPTAGTLGRKKFDHFTETTPGEAVPVKVMNELCAVNVGLDVGEVIAIDG